MAFDDVTPVILAGGLGTRLRSVVADLPKVLAEVQGSPFLAWLLKSLRSQGFRRAVLCTGYGAESIEARFGDEFEGVKLVYSREPFPLGTGGALRFALGKFNSDTLLVLNGDSYCLVDYNDFSTRYRMMNVSAAMVVARIDDVSRFGKVEINIDGLITRFSEKTGGIETGWVSAGIYLLAKNLIAEVEPGRLRSLEIDLFPNWISRGFFAYRASGNLIDIGTPEAFRAANSNSFQVEYLESHKVQIELN